MRAVIWVLVIALVLYSVLWAMQDKFADWLFPTIVQVKTYDEAKADQVKIKWHAEGRQDTLVIVDKGIQIRDDFKAIGFNTFLLYYENQLITTFDQFRQHNVGGNRYLFEVIKRKDSLSIDLKIHGPGASR